MMNDYVTDINVGKIESDDCISREKQSNSCMKDSTCLMTMNFMTYFQKL